MKMAEHKATLDFTKALSPVLRLRESVGSLSASGPSEADQRWQEKGLKRIPTLEWRLSQLVPRCPLFSFPRGLESLWESCRLNSDFLGPSEGHACSRSHQKASPNLNSEPLTHLSPRWLSGPSLVSLSRLRVERRLDFPASLPPGTSTWPA